MTITAWSSFLKQYATPITFSLPLQRQKTHCGKANTDTVSAEKSKKKYRRLRCTSGLTQRRWDTEAQQRCVWDGWLGWGASGRTSLSSHRAAGPHPDTQSWTYLIQVYTTQQHITHGTKHSFPKWQLLGKKIQPRSTDLLLFYLWCGRLSPVEEQLCRETQCQIPHLLLKAQTHKDTVTQTHIDVEKTTSLSFKTCCLNWWWCYC